MVGQLLTINSFFLCARSRSGVQRTRILAQEHANKAKEVLLEPVESELRLHPRQGLTMIR